METGTVKWFDNAKGYCFITWESGEDLFVHFKSISGEDTEVSNKGKLSNSKLNKVQKVFKQ